MNSSRAFLSVEERESYLENGFFIARNIIPEELIRALFTAMAQVAQRIMNVPLRLAHGDASPAGLVEFEKTLLRVRSSHPEQFGSLYDAMYTNVVAQRLIIHEPLVQVAAQLQGDPAESMCTACEGIRMDVPLDRRNILDWHQEISYHFANDDGLNAQVLWIPLQDVNATNGTVIVCPGSHRLGWLKPEKLLAGGGGKSLSIVPPLEQVEQFQRVPVEVKAGDVVIFNMNLFHKSGYNESEHIRFTVRGRCHRMLADDFVPHRFVGLTNRMVRDLRIAESYTTRR
jgi:hypothetical protein